MPARPGTVEIAGVPVGRVAVSLAGLRTTGMWGEPRDRSAALLTVGRAVDLGVSLIEVPAPFGPWADLLRQADPDPDGLVLALRLTGADPGRDLEVARRRLGGRLAARVGLVLARPARLQATRAATAGHPPALGVWVADGAPQWPAGQVAAVRGGPRDTAGRLMRRCRAERIPYLAPDPRVLSAGERTVAVLEPSGPEELDRLYGEAVTPPAAGPG